ncbi:hypothetical protein ACJ41O_010088 [Fusarium nematophilum]
MDVVASSLVRRILALAKVEFRKREARATTATPTIGAKAGVVEVDAIDDDDATNVKQRANRLQAVSYGPDEDENDETQQAAEDDGFEDLEQRASVDGDEEGAEPPALGPPITRAERVPEEYVEVTGFECDETTGGWCSGNARSAIAKTLVREIRNIGSCRLLERAGKKGHDIRADGTDRDQRHRRRAVGVRRRGVCRSNIMRELAAVVRRSAAWGYADMPAPFTKMSFETTLGFLKDAVLDGDWDKLDGAEQPSRHGSTGGN